MTGSSPVSCASTSVPIPYDPEAERQVVGFAIARPADALKLRTLVAPEDFYRPALGRAFHVACHLEHLADPDGRATAVAVAADLLAEEVAGLVEGRGASPSRWATRVRFAARRRRLMGLAAELHNSAAHAHAEHLVTLCADALAVARDVVEDEPAPQSYSETTGGPWPTIGALRRSAVAS